MPSYKAEKQVVIEFIVSQLRQGLERKEILQNISTISEMSSRTFDVRLAEARQVIAEQDRQKEVLREKMLPAVLKKELNAAVATDSELDVILSQIARGKCKVEEWIKGEVVLRDVRPSEIIDAADKLYKRRGSYAPVKQANTNAAGEDVEPPLNDVQVDKIIEALKASK